MRTLNITNNLAVSPARKQIQSRLQKFEKQNLGLDSLLNEIRNGNIDRIEELLVHTEEIILREMLHMPESMYSIDYRVSHVTKLLRELAVISSKDPSRNLFERFSAFYVKQSLLSLEAGEVATSK